MGLSVRDWMIIIGVLLFVAVILDGFRRFRNDRRNTIRMSLNKKFMNSNGGDGETFGSELPAGGARVVNRDVGNIDLGDIENLHNDDEDLNDKPPNVEPVSDLEDSVPILTETHCESQSQSAESNEVDSNTIEELTNEADNLPEEVSSVDNDEQLSSMSADQKSIDTDPSEVLVVNVVAREGGVFLGPDLLHILLACDMRHGEMDIFHRYEQSNGKGSVQFSVASIVAPGTFDLDNINDFSTVGVSFFIKIPGPEDTLQAFDCMVETAHCVVKHLNGEMQDESRSVMTNQTLEHCRQHLIERERRQLTQHAQG